MKMLVATVVLIASLAQPARADVCRQVCANGACSWMCVWRCSPPVCGQPKLEKVLRIMK